MRKTLAAVAAGLLIVAAAPAFAGGGCGSYKTQSVDSKGGDHRTVAQSDHVSTPTTQTATTTVVTQ